MAIESQETGFTQPLREKLALLTAEYIGVTVSDMHCYKPGYKNAFPEGIIQYVEIDQSLFGGQKDNKALVKNILDGCYHVYLDVGSNIGVQVRKLYQPEHFPGAGIINQFRLAFGG